MHSTQVGQEHKIVTSLASQKSQIQSLLSQQHTILSHLQAAQRAQLEAQQATAV